MSNVNINIIVYHESLNVLFRYSHKIYRCSRSFALDFLIHFVHNKIYARLASEILSVNYKKPFSYLAEITFTAPSAVASTDVYSIMWTTA